MAEFVLLRSGKLKECISDEAEILVPEEIAVTEYKPFRKCRNLKKLEFYTAKFDDTGAALLSQLWEAGIEQAAVHCRGGIYPVDFPLQPLPTSLAFSEQPEYRCSWSYSRVFPWKARELYRLFRVRDIRLYGDASADYIEHLDYCEDNEEAAARILQDVWERFADFWDAGAQTAECGGAVIHCSPDPEQLPPHTFAFNSKKTKWHQGYCGEDAFTVKLGSKNGLDFSVETDETVRFQMQLLVLMIGTGTSWVAVETAEEYLLNLMQAHAAFVSEEHRGLLELLYTERGRRSIFTKDALDAVLHTADPAAAAAQIRAMGKAK